MKDILIQVQAGEFYADIPELREAKNCIIDKTITGLGYTHWLLNHEDNKENVILVTPLVAIAKSKVCDGVFPYIGAMHDDPFSRKSKLIKYKRDNSVHKFVVTPELLDELVSFLDTDKVDYCLAIDELDLSVQHSTFRTSMPKLIDTFLSWGENRVACSATDALNIRRDMQMLTQYRIDPQWDIVQDMDLVSTNNPSSTTVDLIKNAVDSGEKWVFFINSSSTINNAIINSGLQSDAISVLAGDNARASVESISEQYGHGYDKTEQFNGRLLTPVTIMTSAYVSGVDVYDKNVNVVFVSNAHGLTHERWSNNQIIQGKGRFRAGIKSLRMVTNFNSKLNEGSFSSKDLIMDATVAAQQIKALPFIADGVDIHAQVTKMYLDNGTCIRTDNFAVNEEMVLAKMGEQSTGYSYATGSNFSQTINEQVSVSTVTVIKSESKERKWTTLKAFKMQLLNQDGTVKENWKDILSDMCEANDTVKQHRDMASLIDGDALKLEIALSSRSVKGVFDALKEKGDVERVFLRICKEFMGQGRIKRSDGNRLLRDIAKVCDVQMSNEELKKELCEAFEVSEVKSRGIFHYVIGKPLFTKVK